MRPQRLVAQLADLLALSGIVAALARLLFHLPLPEPVLTAIGVLGVGGVAWIGRRLASWGKSPTPDQFPGPLWLWRLIYNRVPTIRGGAYAASRESRVLIVTDAAHADEAQEAGANISADVVKVTTHVVTSEDAGAPLAPLLAELRSADAVYVLWTDQMAADPAIGEALTEWAMRNTHKPILVASMLVTHEYALTFPALPMHSARSGPSLLLRRAIERAALWRRQATIFRRICFSAGAIAIGAMLVLLVMSHDLRLIRKIGRLNTPAFEDLRGALDAAHESAEAIIAARSGGGRNRDGFAYSGRPASDEGKYLAGVAGFIEATMSQWYSIPPNKRCQVSFWRRMAVNDSSGNRGLRLVQVAWTGQRPPTIFEDDRQSIIGSAFNEKVFVVWLTDTTRNKVAGWDTDLAECGVYDNPNVFRFYKSHQSGSFKPIPTDQKRVGLLCYAEASKNGHVMSGVTLDLQTDPLALRRQEVVDLIRMVVGLVNAVPDSLLLSDAVVTELERAKLSVVCCERSSLQEPAAIPLGHARKAPQAARVRESWLTTHKR